MQPAQDVLIRAASDPHVDASELVELYALFWDQARLGDAMPWDAQRSMVGEPDAEFWCDLSEAVEWWSTQRVLSLVPKLRSQSIRTRRAALHLVYWHAAGCRSALPPEVVAMVNELREDLDTPSRRVAMAVPILPSRTPSS